MTRSTALLHVSGAVIGLLLAGSAVAADLPMMKAEPVEYVKVCKNGDDEFFYIPGTDTCLAITGLDQADVGFQTIHDRSTDAVFLRNEARLTFDARTNTEAGELRSLIELSALTSGVTGASSSNTVEVRRAFIQFAGLEAGYNYSAFAFYDEYYGDTIFAPYSGEQGRKNILSYTYTHNGAFARVSAESAVDHRESIVGDTEYGGSLMPDIVGAVGYDASKNGFGRVQVMGALHQIRPLDSGTDTKYGFAVGAAAGLNLPFQSKTSFAIEGEYADGAIHYLGPGTSADGLPDAVALGGDLDRGHGFSVEGEVGYALTDKLQSFVFGSYLDYKGADAALAPDYRAWTAGANLNYTLVKGLIVSGEAYYLDRDYTGSTADDLHTVGGGLRINRIF